MHDVAGMRLAVRDHLGSTTPLTLGRESVRLREQLDHMRGVHGERFARGLGERAARPRPVELAQFRFQKPDGRPSTNGRAQRFDRAAPTVGEQFGQRLGVEVVR